MAITDTLRKCLDSPFLFSDADAPARVPALLDRAESRLDGARRLLGGEKPEPADVGALAYESMFAALRALVYARGYREAGLRCLVLAAEAFYVREGAIEASSLLDFERAQGMKLAPAAAVEAAGRFLEVARGLVGTAGPRP